MKRVRIIWVILSGMVGGIIGVGSAIYKMQKVIDKYENKVCTDFEIRQITAGLSRVDVIVVTPIGSYDEIEETLMNLVDYPIVPIGDVIFEC